MEAANSRFKTANRSLLLDSQTLGEVDAIVVKWIGDYSGARRISSISYRTAETDFAMLQP